MEVVRKDIKNLHLAVYPPTGRVRVAVPLCLDDEAVRLAVISRLSWIRRQQASFEQQDRQSEREMVTGESHYVQGRRYRLDVVEHKGPASVTLRNNSTLELRVRPATNQHKREASFIGGIVSGYTTKSLILSPSGNLWSGCVSQIGASRR